MNPELENVPCLISYKLNTHPRVHEHTVDRIIVLNDDVFTIGRANSADFVIKNPIVSSIHAIFTRRNDVWHVADDNSTNGVYVNEVKLEAHNATSLKHGDTVCFGEETASRELLFTFKSDGSGESDRGPSGGDKMKKENERLEKELKRVQDELSQQKRKAEETLKRKLKQKEEEFEKKMAIEKEKVRTLLERKSKNGRRNGGKIRFERLVDNMKGQVDANRLQLELAEDGDKSRLERMLEVKERHLAIVSEELETMAEKHKSQSEIVSKLSSVLESELECCVCSEIIIKAVVLNCSHSFCSHCINEWKREKCECPVCRTEITSETPSRVLDSIIDSMVETWSSELITRRRRLIENRMSIQHQQPVQQLPGPLHSVHEDDLLEFYLEQQFHDPELSWISDSSDSFLADGEDYSNHDEEGDEQEIEQEIELEQHDEECEHEDEECEDENEEWEDVDEELECEHEELECEHEELECEHEESEGEDEDEEAECEDEDEECEHEDEQEECEQEEEDEECEDKDEDDEEYEQEENDSFDSYSD